MCLHEYVIQVADNLKQNMQRLCRKWRIVAINFFLNLDFKAVKEKIQMCFQIALEGNFWEKNGKVWRKELYLFDSCNNLLLRISVQIELETLEFMCFSPLNSSYSLYFPYFMV